MRLNDVIEYASRIYLIERACPPLEPDVNPMGTKLAIVTLQQLKQHGRTPVVAELETPDPATATFIDNLWKITERKLMVREAKRTRD
jgi:hypothetical protein